MPLTKLVLLVAKIFTYSAVVGAAIFFAGVYTNAFLVNMFLPAYMHAVPSLGGSTMYALYTGLQFSLFFTTFALAIIRLSIVSATVLTLRDIVRYYKIFIISSVILSALLVSSLCIYFTNFSGNKLDVAKALMGQDILAYTMPCFWLALTLLFYRTYRIKVNEPDGSKDRSWLEGNFEK
jgi:hypothetical protein